MPIPKNAQLILLGQDKSDFLMNIYDNIEGKSILLISENYQDKQNVMINLYDSPNQELLFEVNTANVINQNLAMDPEILLNGGSSIDVASLYRNVQIKMRDKQKLLDKMGDSLNILNNNIQKVLNQIIEQKAEILSQEGLIKLRNDELNSNQSTIGTQKILLKLQKDSIKSKSRILDAQQNEIKKQYVELAKQEEILRAKQKQIEQKQNEINTKNAAIGTQSETIQHQKQLLSSVLIIAVLVVLLSIAIINGYRNNRRKNKILTAQKIEIEEKLEELRQLNIKLQEADQYKSIFLASMSHELRTPLNSIIGYTGIMLMGLAGELNNEQKTQLLKVKNNGTHLLSLINDVLDISKIEADKVELELEEFNIKDLVKEILDIVYPRANEKKLSLSSEIPDDFVLYSDKRRIKQVIINLVTNAINYSNEGSIQVKAIKIEDNKMKLSVIDTGIGISDKDLARLFQPFQQIDSSLTKPNKGTGLGLYLCRKIMHLLEGDILVNSQDGIGSEFYIVVPFAIKNNKGRI
jgi:signal transduction histidine kinase